MNTRKSLLLAVILLALSSCSTGYKWANAPGNNPGDAKQLDKLAIKLYVSDNKKQGDMSTTLMISHIRNKSGLKLSSLALTLTDTQNSQSYIAGDTVILHYAADTVIEHHKEILANHDLASGKTIRIAERTTYTFTYRFTGQKPKQIAKYIQAKVEFNQTDTTGAIIKIDEVFNFNRYKYLNVSGN